MVGGRGAAVGRVVVGRVVTVVGGTDVEVDVGNAPELVVEVGCSSDGDDVVDAGRSICSPSTWTRWIDGSANGPSAAEWAISVAPQAPRTHQNHRPSRTSSTKAGR